MQVTLAPGLLAHGHPLASHHMLTARLGHFCEGDWDTPAVQRLDMYRAAGEGGRQRQLDVGVQVVAAALEPATAVQ